MSAITLALALVALHGLDGQTVYVNPHEIVSVREPTSALLHADIKCSLQTADGRLINVTDSCDAVLKAVETDE